jgi:hypothetical protein
MHHVEKIKINFIVSGGGFTAGMQHYQRAAIGRQLPAYGF